MPAPTLEQMIALIDAPDPTSPKRDEADVSDVPTPRSNGLGCSDVEGPPTPHGSESGMSDTPDTSFPANLLNTFLPEYHSILRSLPVPARPLTVKHGRHSYTIAVGESKLARIEVLLKQQAMKAKYDMHGAKMDTASSFGLTRGIPPCVLCENFCISVHVASRLRVSFKGKDIKAVFEKVLESTQASP